MILPHRGGRMGKIADKLLNERVVVTIGGGFTINRLDISGIRKIKVLYFSDHTLVIESNAYGFLFDDFRIQKGILFSLPPHIIPNFIIERTNLGWRAELGGHIFART